MIVPMKKVTLLTLSSEENVALTALRQLGIMQIEHSVTNRSAVTSYLIDLRATTHQVLTDLQKFHEECEECGELPAVDGRRRSGAEAVEQADILFSARKRLGAELFSIHQRQERLAAWGEFDRAAIEALHEKGIWVYLCSGNRRSARKAGELPSAAVQIISEEGGKLYFAVVTPEPVPAGVLPEVRFEPGDNPPELRKQERELENELKLIESEIAELLPSIPAVVRRLSQLDGELEFSRVSDSLVAHGEVVSLLGFVPAPSTPALEKAASEHGWGLLIEDPAPGDRVPTLRRNSKVVQLIEPLLQFLGIEPGYHEIDVSGGILIFFTIFYAMIVGDAGYGVIFLLGTLLAAWKFRGKAAAKLPIMLFGLLSVAAIIWGVLTGNIFGTAGPEWLHWAAIPQLTSDPHKDSYTQLVCFTLALLQLSLGRFWRAIYDGTIRSFIGNIGWVFFLLGNYMLTYRLLVFSGPFPQAMYVCYLVGFLMVVIGGVDWTDIAQVFQLPFSIINSFVDLLSYIRLFAVGLAGYYIAISFNGMGVSVFNSGPVWLTLLPATLVILAGHAVNIALCLMSVLVHGVRLNTLEFSGQVGLGWTGAKFKPFKNKRKTEEG